MFWQQDFPMDISYILDIFTSMKDFLSSTRTITKMASVYKSWGKKFIVLGTTDSEYKHTEMNSLIEVFHFSKCKAVVVF